MTGEHTCDPADPDCAAFLHYSDPANHQPADGARGRRLRPRRQTSHVPVRFQPAVIERVKVVAERDGLTVSSWVRRLVERELDQPSTPATREQP